MFNILIIFISLSLSAQVSACSCLDEEMGGIYTNPLLAKTVLIIKVKGEGYHQHFSAETPWPSLDKKLDGQGCEIGGVAGKKYLFLSHQNIDQLREGSFKVISSCDAIISELSNSKNEIEKLSKVKEFPVGYPNVFWGYCQTDSECTKVKKSCGDVNSVNKKYRTNLENYIKESGSKCDRKDVKGKISKCVENFCS